VKRIVWLIGVVLAAGLAGSWWTWGTWGRTGKAPRSHAPSRSEESVSEQLRELDLVTRRLAARVDRAETAVPHGGPAPSASHASADADPADEAWSRLSPTERNQLVVTSTLELLEDVVTTEVLDNRWSADARGSLSTVLSSAEFEGTTIASVDCMVSLCRFRVLHDGPEARERFRPAMSRAPLRGNLFFHYDPVKGETVVYVAREGQQLPRADFREAAARLAP
jgi:hypothetical protein